VVHNARGLVTRLREVVQDLCAGDEVPVPDVLFFQETNISQANLGQVTRDLPRKFAVACNDTLTGHMKGVLTMVRPGSLLGPSSIIEPLVDKSTTGFDMLAVMLRGIIFINVYFHVGLSASDKAQAMHDMMEEISDLLSQYPDAQVVLGGDFNYPGDNDLLVDTLSGLDFEPVYPASGKPEATHARGNVLDWIFVRGQIKAEPLTILPRGEDHFVLSVSLTVPLPTETGSESDCFCWNKLNELAPEKQEALQKEVLEAAKGATLSDFRAQLRHAILPRYLGIRKPKLGRIPRAWFERDIGIARKANRVADRDYHRHPTPENREKARLARKVYYGLMRKRKRQARAEMASHVEANHSSIYRIVVSKKGSGCQRRFVPNLEATLRFWTAHVDLSWSVRGS
jgi:hypothetical protein